MKISVNKILYHHYTKLINNKYHEFQLSFMWNPYLHYSFEFDLTQQFGYLFSFNYNLFGLFTCNIYKNKETDHAGFYFNINILGLDIDYSYKDNRHWDYDNDKWEVNEGNI